jgi:hypothetical protein
MRAACLAVSEGEANEIELEWTRPIDSLGEQEERLTITVRREVKHFRMGEGTYTEDGETDG